jgi:eight-cysteine-cluster-containing protein
MQKNFMYAAASILAVVLVAFGILYMGGLFGGGAHEGTEGGETPGGNTTDLSSEKLFFEAILNPSTYSEYEYAYDEISSSGYSNSVYMASNAGSSYVRREDAVFKRELFVNSTTQILCFGNVNRDLCSVIPTNSTFNPYAYTLTSLFFTPESVQVNYQMNKKFIEFGALKMGPEMVEKEYIGKKCTEIYYTVDYTKMTVEQMMSLGIDSSSAEVLVSKQYNFSVCIDPQTKELIHKKMVYLNLGVPMYTEYYTTTANWGTGNVPSTPTELVSESSLQMFFTAAKTSQQKFVECLLGNNTDSCLRSEAISSGNQKLCKEIEGVDMRDSCYVNIGLGKKDPSFCGQISPEFADDCYMEFAWRFMNLSYCGMMGSAETIGNCTELVGAEIADWESNGTTTTPINETEVAPVEETPATGECTTASDCVRAGCSTQLCVPSSQSDIITTCEYKSSYDCLPLSSCGCNEGKCGWAQTPDYLNCLDSKKIN